MKYIGMVVIAIVGTLLHFTYELSHHNKAVAVFSAVNESTWEHIKICMTPTLLWSIYDFIKYGSYSNYLIAKSISIFSIILLIPILFYSYTIISKKAILFIDVICFYITVFLSQSIFYYIISLNPLSNVYFIISIALLLISLLSYAIFTFKPLKNFIFEDPISHKYGLEGHTHFHHHD